MGLVTYTVLMVRNYVDKNGGLYQKLLVNECLRFIIEVIIAEAVNEKKAV